MKRKTFIIFSIIVALGLCIFGAWLVLKPTDSSTFSGFIRTLKQNDCKVIDVTKDYAKKYPENQKFPDNQKVLDVDGNIVYISMETDETVNSSVEKYMSSYSNGLHDFTGQPHLYRKGKLLARYFGDDKKLLRNLEDILGKSLIN